MPGPLLTFVVGLAVLLLAGQLVVSRASALGARLGLSPLVIGVTIVAAGTSAPELAVFGQAIAVDDTDLAVGSIIGSNIANVLLVLGIAACMGTIRVVSRVVWVDIPVMIGASTLFLLFALDRNLSRGDGVVLIAVLIAFVVWTLRSTRQAADHVPSRAEPTEVPSLRSTLLGLALGIMGLTVAARFVVSGAEGIAVALGVPELVIGLTVLAVGTSAPEIATTLIAASRGQKDLAVGNAVGSNIFNLLLVLGLTGLIAPGGIPISDDALRLDVPVLLAAALACLPFVAHDHKLDRWEGALFVTYYVAYVAFLVLDGTGHRLGDPFIFVVLAFAAPLTAVTGAVLVGRRITHRRALVADATSSSSPRPHTEPPHAVAPNPHPNQEVVRC